ncbi:MAG: SH3 domain-containing protein [Anaerolineaceae bacterium]|nr:SH3 domain-containing protein [Anaerolineaceae bacterium]
MKKIMIIFTITAVLLSSCTLAEQFSKEEPTEVPPTPAPTATPDPCAPENLVETVKGVQDLVNAFQDTAYVANFTPLTELVSPIMELQAIRRELQKLDVPPCEEAIKSAAINYMNSTINYLAFFMGGEVQENVDAGIQNSQVLWQVVLGEFSKLLSSAGLVNEGLPEINSSMPTMTDSGIYVSNEGTQSVNVRSQPDLNASIIAELEPGMQAIGLARNEAGEWIQVNLDGVIGWVFAETVELTTAVEELPVSEPTP